MSKRLDKLGELAREQYANDNINIDTPLDINEISEGDDGIWVKAWVFLDNDALKTNNITNPYA